MATLLVSLGGEGLALPNPNNQFEHRPFQFTKLQGIGSPFLREKCTKQQLVVVRAVQRAIRLLGKVNVWVEGA